MDYFTLLLKLNLAWSVFIFYLLCNMTYSTGAAHSVTLIVQTSTADYIHCHYTTTKDKLTFTVWLTLRLQSVILSGMNINRLVIRKLLDSSNHKSLKWRKLIENLEPRSELLACFTPVPLQHCNLWRKQGNSS